MECREAASHRAPYVFPESGGCECGAAGSSSLALLVLLLPQPSKERGVVQQVHCTAGNETVTVAGSQVAPPKEF